MKKVLRLTLVLLMVLLAVAACRKEKNDEEDEFSFVVYPGARYLPQLTEVTKQATKILRPTLSEVPPTAIYDSEAGVEDVANYYVKAYGYPSIAPSAPTDPNTAKPPAYRRSGDLQADFKSVESLLPKLNLHPDGSKALGTYNAVEIAGKPNRPRVTIQRPYFDLTTSQVVDRTIILMSR